MLAVPEPFELAQRWVLFVDDTELDAFVETYVKSPAVGWIEMQIFVKHDRIVTILGM